MKLYYSANVPVRKIPHNEDMNSKKNFSPVVIFNAFMKKFCSTSTKDIRRTLLCISVKDAPKRESFTQKLRSKTGD